MVKSKKDIIDAIEKIIALINIVFKSVSPGLLVKIYRKKLIVITNCIKKIHIKKGSCFCIPLKKIIIKDSDIARKIIPNISDSPATA